MDATNITTTSSTSDGQSYILLQGIDTGKITLSDLRDVRATPDQTAFETAVQRLTGRSPELGASLALDATTQVRDGGNPLRESRSSYPTGSRGDSSLVSVAAPGSRDLPAGRNPVFEQAVTQLSGFGPGDDSLVSLASQSRIGSTPSRNGDLTATDVSSAVPLTPEPGLSLLLLSLVLLLRQGFRKFHAADIPGIDS